MTTIQKQTTKGWIAIRAFKYYIVAWLWAKYIYLRLNPQSSVRLVTEK